MMPYLLLSVYLASAAPGEVYPNAKLLTEPTALAKSLETYRIVDVRQKATYDAGHIVGAVNVNASGWSKAVNAGTADSKFWRAELATLGISPEKPVVVYGEDIRDYCRVWWLLKHAGVENVSVLNGGWQGYLAIKAPTETKTNTPLAKPHDWKPIAERRVTKAQLLEQLTTKTEAIFDARTPDEFTSGRVPGATPIAYTDVFDDTTTRFKTAKELGELFAARKFDPAKPCITYCQSGGRAAVLAFSLELMGAKTVRNYYKSWSEWGTASDTPKEK